MPKLTVSKILKNPRNHEKHGMPRSNLAAKGSVYVHANSVQCAKMLTKLGLDI